MRVVLHLDPDDIEIVEPGGDGPFPFLLAVDSIQVGVKAGHLKGLFNVEAASCRLSFDNIGDKFVDLADYPLRVFVEVFDDNDESYFEGLIQAVEYGPAVTITLEA